MPELQTQRILQRLSLAPGQIPDASAPTDGQNAAMGLKLFHETGFSSILGPGETRVGLHPAWLILAVSLWVGFAANVALWRAIAGTDRTTGLGQALAIGLLIAGSAAAALSLLGWRKTLKPAAILVLVVAALAAASVWSQALPVDATLLSRKPSTLLVPSWPTLLRWQVPAALAGLALVPGIWVWRRQLRRVSLGQQLGINLLGVLTGLGVAAASAFVLGQVPA